MDSLPCVVVLLTGDMAAYNAYSNRDRPQPYTPDPAASEFVYASAEFAGESTVHGTVIVPDRLIQSEPLRVVT